MNRTVTRAAGTGVLHQQLRSHEQFSHWQGNFPKCERIWEKFPQNRGNVVSICVAFTELGNATCVKRVKTNCGACFKCPMRHTTHSRDHRVLWLCFVCLLQINWHLKIVVWVLDGVQVWRFIMINRVFTYMNNQQCIQKLMPGRRQFFIVWKILPLPGCLGMLAFIYQSQECPHPPWLPK